uniref:Reverse transcriptase RNase H-like domain-containing protein n=1 Tax=Lotharella globosa TaxID=91324 RepID=A0A7S4DTU1_9EUKA
MHCQRKADVLQWDGADVLMWVYIWTCVDDDACGTDTVIAHIFVLCVVFDRFLMFGFTLRIAKCNFLVPELKHGGHIVGCRHVKPNPKKAEKTSSIPEPKTLKELRSFLQQAAWILRRYAPEYADASSTLSSAHRKPNDRRPFRKVWEELNLSKHFERMKKMCEKEMINVSFDPDCTDTQLCFDWSKVAIAGVLVQRGQIVRVWGRSCNDSESRHSPVKGENLAFHDVQLAMRAYLLSLKFFDAITDHRPLLGIDAKADIQDLDPMFTKWREGTEQFRPRRRLIHVVGSKNLSDFWSRLWPSKKLPDEGSSLIMVLLSEERGDFALTPEDDKELETISKNGLVLKGCGNYMSAYIKNQWRTYVPIRQRIPLIQSLHLPLHLGENKLRDKLSPYYFPKKKQLLKGCLRSCSCSRVKSDGNPRNESTESRLSRKVEAKAPHSEGCFQQEDACGKCLSHRHVQGTLRV